jgi:hypothetical protein
VCSRKCFSKSIVINREKTNAKCSSSPNVHSYLTCPFHFYHHRSGMLSLLQSSTSWWALIVNDYGTIISSLLALATFASLFFLVYVLHKTLSPRGDTNRPTSADKQKKKKRRGNHHQKGNHGRIKGTPQQQQRTKSAPSSVESPEHALESISTIDSDKKEMMVQESDHVFSLPALVEDKPLSPSSSLPTSVPSPERLIKALKEDTAPSRTRITSASTVDTTNFPDDQSFGTVSGRSTPTASVILPATESVPTVSTSTVGQAILPATELVLAVSVSTTGRADNNQIQPLFPSTRKQLSRRAKKHENVDVFKAPASKEVSIVPSSRWDALKPNHPVGAGRRVHPKGRTGPQPGARFHSVQNRPNQQSPLITPIARPTIQSPTLAPAEPIHNPIPGFDLVVPREVVSPAAASLQSCEIGASTWSQLPTMSYEDTPLTGLLAPFAMSPERNSSVAETYFATPLRPNEQTTFFSSELDTTSSELNANSPSWSQTKVASLAAPAVGSVRAPPGLTLADDGKGLQSSFSPTPSKSPFLSTYPSLSERPSPPFGMPSPLSYNVKENPFDESDNDENDDLIEAELQELGGQMVGSILDF